MEKQARKFTKGNSPPGPQPTIRRRTRDIDAHDERAICIGMIVSEAFLEKIAPIALPELFQAPWSRRIAGWCTEHYQEYGHAPGKDIESIYARRNGEVSEEEATLIGELLESLSGEYENQEKDFDVKYTLDKAKCYFGLTSIRNLQAKLQQPILSGKPEEGKQLIREWLDKAESQTDEEAPKQFVAKEVTSMRIPEPKWAIPNLLPEGLSILAGKPKKGKSLFALNIALAITGKSAALGNITVEGGSVIYLALEDTLRRLQSRIIKMLNGRPGPGCLYLYPQSSCFPRMPDGLTHLENEIKRHDDLRLVVIDTWVRFKPPENEKRLKTDSYYVSSDDMGKLKALADKYKTAILVIHHMRKTGSDDIVDTFHGSVGLTGTADGLLALVRKGQSIEATLDVSGRDMEAQAIALKLNPDNLTWENMGTASEVQLTEQRQAIFDAILDNEAPMTPKEIAEATGLKSINTTLQRMEKQGSLVKTGRGKRDVKYDVPVDARMRWEMNREKVVPMRRRRGN